MKLLLVSAFSVATVVACVGWGRTIEAAVGGWGGGTPLPRLSTGTVGCVGLAAFLCVAGTPVAFDQYRPWMAWLWVGIGCALAALALARGQRIWKKAWRVPWLGIAAGAVLGALVVYQTGTSLGIVVRWNPCDDLASYIPLVHRLNETGGLIEPFSLRRMTGLGGATVFESLFTSTFGPNTAYVADFTVGSLLIGLILLPLPSKLPRFGLGVLLVLSFTLWNPLRANLTPAYLPAALIAAGVLVVVETERSRSTLLDRRVLALIALLCAGLLTLRTPFALPLAIFGFALILRASVGLGDRLRATVFFCLATGLLVVPWMIALWRSSGTPLYPPISGNLVTSWPGLRVSGDSLLTRLGDVLGTEGLPWLLGGILLTGVTLMKLRRSAEFSEGPMLGFLGAAITAVLLVLTTGATTHDLARYVWPLLAGVVIAALATLANELSTPLRGIRDRTATLIIVAIAVVVAVSAPVGTEIDLARTGIAKVWSGNDPPVPTDSVHFEYVAAQKWIPPGAKAATTADYPYYFNYNRNDLVNLDILGSVSASPGMPLGGGAKATTDYLRNQGFQFVISTWPRKSTCLYNRQSWNNNLRNDEPYARSIAPYFLDWFRWLDERARDAPGRVTKFRSLRVIDLRGRG